MSDVELKPCPFCGYHAATIFRQRTPVFRRRGWLESSIAPKLFYVQCESTTCGVQGPLGDCALTAEEAWNTRPEEDRLRSALQVAERERDLRSAQIGMIASELAGDSKLHWLNDRSDPRWTPTIQEAWSLRQKVREDAKQIVGLMHERDAALARAEKAERERDELRALINTPQTSDFLEAVKLEAAHQVERWGSEHDEGKSDSDWFWLLGYLAGKAIRPGQPLEKVLHHIITTAAACLNWHKQKTGTETLHSAGVLALALAAERVGVR